MSGTSRVGVGTVVTKNYLSFARVVVASLRDHHPDLPVVVALADEPEGCFDPAAEPFHVISLSELQIPHVSRMLFRYARQQTVVAAKPYLLAQLLDRGCKTAWFIDADILVTGSLDELLDPASGGAITLVPHLLAPLQGADRIDRELNILQSGVFNGGVVGVRDCTTGRAFLDWWQDRVYEHCLYAVEEGMHYDQRWLDLVPMYFDDVRVLRDPCVNIAHWNLPERSVSFEQELPVADGASCRLVHFSGFDPDRPNVVTRYSNRLEMRDIGDAALLFARYRRALEDAGWHETRTWPYAYNRFDNGVTIPTVVRSIYRELGHEAARFGDPFETAPHDSYYRWLTEPARRDCTTSNLWLAIHRRRPDLQHAFPDPLDHDQNAYRHWAETHGAHEHAFPTELVPGGDR